MDALNYSFLRQNLASVMDRVNDGHAPLLVTRQSGKPVVLMSLDHFNALQESACLLRSPASAKRLAESIDQLRGADGTVREPVHAD